MPRWRLTSGSEAGAEVAADVSVSKGLLRWRLTSGSGGTAVVEADVGFRRDC